ncbi:helix-hairpin-helix domain-containing protein [Conexibacter sp. JD483]|uniref:ComEA family DNA-binding protein n=1 Tax=unclassified Conexibacter TaxID=2627773 RepID=UPI00271A49BD|nr:MULTISPECIES: helix-hairpin-helix domain-containing protein [unclassified Conexibacter]MDO8189408.1 helix-hairpin-helix domain-containing protein [Conexibacter sp. CPCC 205706]MDO8202017.1 helix-hairpin-helix domain-containing protein [Conexibacter sp. CPCC 205762]MDR9372480.1 helix-hairpin-helix domain-containing protein [Conexibacter sp. JD483]
MTVATFAVIGSSDEDPATPVGLVILIVWIGSIVHAFVIRKEFVRRLDLRLLVEDSELDREIALGIARDDPAQAAQLGIGRPDLPGATTGGVVDVNHASVTVLATLPGIGDRLARQIVGTRQAMGLFSSVAELGMVLDLPASTVERLRPLVIFLPD